MAKPNYQKGYDSFVRALVQLSDRTQTCSSPLDKTLSGESPSDQASPLARLHEEESLADYETPTLLGVSSIAHADPLAPLRPRDEQALIELFTHDSIEEIAEEVKGRLSCLYPEPCWEDDPFEFLQRYL